MRAFSGHSSRALLRHQPSPPTFAPIACDRCAREHSQRAGPLLASAAETSSALTNAVDQLKDPAHLKAQCRKQHSVKDAGGAVSLHDYMTLPLEQYFVLDASLIKSLGGDTFKLFVPPLSVLGTSIRPEAVVTVRQTGSSVVLETKQCQLYGSQLVESLNEKFHMRFTTELTWDAPTLTRGVEPGEQRTIFADAKLDVWCEVVSPFHLIPRFALEKACSAVTATLLQTLLPWFVRQLAEDYEQWAADEDYRRERALRSEPLEHHTRS